MNKLFTLALALVALNACAAQTPEEDPPVAAEESALDNGTGSVGGYPCPELMCTCTGDEECNRMFGSGVCGPIASCDTTNDPPTCRCLKLGARATTNPKLSLGGGKVKAAISP